MLHTARMGPRRFSLPIVLCALAIALQAKDQPAQVIVWPTTGTPLVRFTLGKFKGEGSFETRRTYVIDIVADNLSSKTIPNGAFFLYLFDKKKVRIGQGWITLTNVAPNQSVRFPVNIDTSGIPATATIVAARDVPNTVSITVNSVPQGALLKVDGVEAGTTPKAVQVGVGKHMLEFSKEGFNTGHFPLEISSTDVSGGSVSYELGTSAHDTVELRDGSVLTGDLESVSATEVVLRMGGTLQHLNRNQVKRILLVERDAPTP
jgi:hypothetical protein